MQYNVSPSGKSIKVAVVGTGISGMASAWLLSQKHHVTVFEKNDRIGGHTNTFKLVKGAGTIPIDTGFIVYNQLNYPNFVELLKHLQVKTQPTDMSFSVSLNQGTFEFGSSDLNSFFGQRSNLFKAEFWRMLQDIRKFFRETSELKTDEPEENPITLGEFLAQRQYGQTFIDKFILPMGAAIWSTKSDDIKNQPLQSFVEFFASHGLLQFRNPVKWQTIIGGSREYVKKITANYHDCIKLGNGVKKIERKPNSVVVFDDQNATHVFDQIVIASHADEALSLLSDADKNERELLSAFKYNDSRVLLHSDESLMPHRKKVWSSWNFLGNNTNGVSVTYWMNLLQSIDNKIPYFVSVNPKFEPNPSLLHNSFQYQHPCFDVKAWEAQKKLWKLQGNNNTWFCGSYFGYGFHEDALQAGLAVAEELGGVERPWKIYGNSARIYRFNGLERVASD